MNRISAATPLFSFLPSTALRAGLCLVAFVALSSALEATVFYPDKMGATVNYTSIQEETTFSTSGKGDGLFGEPTVSGDSLDFDPNGFSANSFGGGPSDVLDVRLSFMIEAKDGSVINSILLTEAGDTNLDNGFSDDNARTIVTANVFIDILEVDGVGINQINVQDVMTFTPSGGDYELAVDNPGGSTLNVGWSGSYFLELGAVLAANSISGDVTKVTVTLDNTLTATSAAGSSAFINKKDSDGVVITANPDDNMIPEPTTMALVFGGLIALPCVRRR